MLFKTAMLAIFSVMLATAGQLLLRAGMDQVGYVGASRVTRPIELVLDVSAEPRVLAGLLLFGLSALAWLIVLSRAPLSFAYPFAGLTYVLVALFGKYVLNEDVPALRWFGIALIIGGIILVGRTAPTGVEAEVAIQVPQDH